MRIIKANY